MKKKIRKNIFITLIIWGILMMVLLVKVYSIRNKEASVSKSTYAEKGSVTRKKDGGLGSSLFSNKIKISKKDLIKQRVKEEIIEEKYVSKKLKAYDNEIRPEETAIRLYPSQERELRLTLNNPAKVKVKIISDSEDVEILNNNTLYIDESNYNDQFRKYYIRARDNARVGKKVKIKLYADNLRTETVIVTIEAKPRDTKDINLYYDMVPGMSLSTTFITSVLSGQGEHKLDYTYKIKNYDKGVLIKKDGEIRAQKIGDSVVTVKYKTNIYKVYIRVREEESYPQSNKEETSIHIVNPVKEDLYVGDEYSLIAVTLPFMSSKDYGIYYNNIISYKSSNPKVCTVTFGVIRAEGEGTCTITAYNRDKKLSTSMDVKVVKKKSTKYDKNNTMVITPQVAAEYGLSKTDGVATKNGLNKIVSDAKKEGKKKVYFSQPLELGILPDQTGILVSLASNTVYDFNKTKIQVLGNSIDNSGQGYAIFGFNGVENSSIENAIIIGTKQKSGNLISLPEAVNCGVVNCDLSWSRWLIDTYPGYYDHRHIKDIDASIFEFGNIRSDGKLSESKCRVRSKDYIDISHIDADEDFMIGDFTEYADYTNCNSILYDIAYYDANKKFLNKESCHAQFFAYYRPKNAKYAKIVFHQEKLPTNGKGGYCVKIGHIKRAYNCYIKNNIIHNSTVVAVVMCGEQNCVLDGNLFYNDGESVSDLVWEDFFQAKSCDIVKNNTFLTRHDNFAMMSGTGYVFRNNAFYNQAFINIDKSVKYFRFYGNVLKNIPSVMENKCDSIVANNVFNATFYFKLYESDKELNGILPRLRVENNTAF